MRCTSTTRDARMKPNFLVILIDDLRYDEFGAGGHPYMQTPHIDRLAREGAIFERAFHTTPICSPNRASIVSGQYASRHGIIDNVARDAMSHRLPNYHLELQRLGYETAHIGKWHMGNDGMPRPGYDTWVSYDGHGKLNDPRLNHDGKYVQHSGYITDIMNGLAVDFLKRKRNEAVFAVLRAQGGAPGCGASGRRHVAHLGTGRLCRRRAAQGSVSRRRVPAHTEHVAACRGDQEQAGVGRKLRDEIRRYVASDPIGAAIGRAGRNSLARPDDGGGRRRRRRDHRRAGKERRARQHVHCFLQRQRLLLWRARARDPSGASLTKRAFARRLSFAIRAR